MTAMQTKLGGHPSVNTAEIQPYWLINDLSPQESLEAHRALDEALSAQRELRTARRELEKRDAAYQAACAALRQIIGHNPDIALRCDVVSGDDSTQAA